MTLFMIAYGLPPKRKISPTVCTTFGQCVRGPMGNGTGIATRKEKRKWMS